MGSPCRVFLPSLKYFEVFPPLMTHDSWLFSNTFIHSISSFPIPIFPSIVIYSFIVFLKWWLTESKAISISFVTKKPSLFKTSLISDISLPPSLIHLFYMDFDLEILFRVRHF